jgi:hypothetical protein
MLRIREIRPVVITRAFSKAEIGDFREFSQPKEGSGFQPDE